MKDEEPRFSDHEKQAIDAIGRDLDREYGTAHGSAEGDAGGAAPTEPPAKLRTGLLVGAGTLALAALVAVTAVVASRLLSPEEAVSPRDRAVVSSTNRRSEPVATLIKGLPTDTTAIVEPAAGPLPRDARAASGQTQRHDSPCPPGTRVQASSPAHETGRTRVARAPEPSRVRPAARRESSTFLSVAVTTPDRRHVEAP